MKKHGVRIDVEAMNELTERVDADVRKAEQKLIDTYGITGDIIASSKQLGARLNELGIHSPVRTKAGAESWSADAMSRIHHPVVPMIEEYKNYVAVRDKYLHGSLASSVIGDRIHCTFSPNKREEGGTVTGRFACSKPNLQNIPARSKAFGTNYGQDMRALFLPEEGCMIGAFDYSQIEYLLLAHYARGPQAPWFREQANAGVDFHTVAMQATGIPTRQVVKTFNYGVIYGMGWRTAMEKNYMLFEKLAKEHGETIETFTQDIYNSYHAKLPVIRETMEYVQNIAKMQGYVTTLGGRREHKPKPQFDPMTRRINDFIYKMLNKLIQGSAADVLKYALRTAYKAGVFDVLTMHITVHDENVVSIPFNKIGTEAAVELQNIMNNSFKDVLLVPMKACAEVGPNWGYWSGDIWEQMKLGNFDPALFNKDYKETH
jgi:DNA polymerase-1